MHTERCNARVTRRGEEREVKSSKPQKPTPCPSPVGRGVVCSGGYGILAVASAIAYIGGYGVSSYNSLFTHPHPTATFDNKV